MAENVVLWEAAAWAALTFPHVHEWEDTSETFHVGFSLQSSAPLPVTFYLSPETLASNSGVSDEHIARLLLGHLTVAVKHHREAQT